MLRTFVLILTICSLQGCGLLKLSVANSKQFDRPDSQKITQPPDDALAQIIADQFALMAWLADVAYRRDLKDETPSRQGCDNGRIRPLKELPVSSSAGAWMPWDGENACFSSPSGLYYETYVFRDADGIVREAVITYRGTENRPDQFIRDWSANLTNALGFEPRQYAQARKQLEGLIQGLLASNNAAGKGTPKIYATGHSLGGGLAQQAGYLSTDIEAVYAFNTSPVTNWSNLRLRKEVIKNYPNIYRVSHGGEALEPVRFFATSFTKTRFNRYDIMLQLADRRAFKGHAMQLISCNLLEIASTAYGEDKLAENPLPAEAEEQPKDYANHNLSREAAGQLNAKYCPPPESEEEEEAGVDD